MSQGDKDKTQPVETAATPASPPVLPTDIAPTIFVDGLEGFIYNDETIRLNIFEDVIVSMGTNGAAIQRRTAAHLIITHRVMDQVYNWLGDQIAQRNAQAQKSRNTNPGGATGKAAQ